MTNIELRQSPSYPSDPGTGLRITAKNGTVEFGLTWDGAERFIAHVDPNTISEIAWRASHWPQDLTPSDPNRQNPTTTEAPGSTAAQISRPPQD